MQPKADTKSLLAAGRVALQAGDLAKAKSLANEAEKASSIWTNWWGDSPTKLLRDIQTAEAKAASSLPTPITENPPKKNPDITEPAKQQPSTSRFGSGIFSFGSNSTPTPTSPPPLAPAVADTKKNEDSSERRVDAKMAHQMVQDGFVFLQANDLPKARLLAMKAKELNVAWGPNEQTPDMLLHEIQRQSAAPIRLIRRPRPMCRRRAAIRVRS